MKDYIKEEADESLVKKIAKASWYAAKKAFQLGLIYSLFIGAEKAASAKEGSTLKKDKPPVSDTEKKEENGKPKAVLPEKDEEPKILEPEKSPINIDFLTNYNFINNKKESFSAGFESMFNLKGFTDVNLGFEYSIIDKQQKGFFQETFTKMLNSYLGIEGLILEWNHIFNHDTKYNNEKNKWGSRDRLYLGYLYKKSGGEIKVLIGDLLDWFNTEQASVSGKLNLMHSNFMTIYTDFYADYSSFKNKIREHTAEVNGNILFGVPDLKIGAKLGVRFESTDETPFTTVDYYKKQESFFKTGVMFLLRPFEDLQIIGYVGANLSDYIWNMEASVSAGMTLGYKEKKILLQEPSKPYRWFSSTPYGWQTSGDGIK